MTEQRKSPAAGGASEIVLQANFKDQNINVASFQQEPIYWQALRESIRRADENPTPINRIIAQCVAARWKIIAKSEVFNG
jgi:hypothetical protein